MATITYPLTPSSRPFAGLSARLAPIGQRYCYHRTITALSSLSDNQLKMAGIARADISSMAARVACN